MKTLYVTDLDGTLLNTKDCINPRSIAMINSLVDQGMTFTYATARSLVSASVVAKGLSTKIPVIVYNGCRIIQPDSGEVLFSVDFEKEEQEEVKSFLTKQGISPLVYAFINGIERVSWNPQYENEGIRRYLQSRKNDKRFRPVNMEEQLYEGNIFYYTCIGEKEKLLPVYEKFKDNPTYRCTLAQELYREEYWCEIMPAKATKANAIQILKTMWNCDRVVAFGDAINDIPMFQIADAAYAVENAVEELKRYATGIIADNDHDGVADWLANHAKW
ncbi:HAD family hydrolase [Anaerosporobacter faecicola]|uniref:HAD family hydrolase n=1 Tax=Anaerosporobacter faecicola TaxID=2718714 RepID=UPI00143ACAB4|nr:HAD family hydrolase [Anaerosporobacter faecicola]